jgi:hypothetical protein
MMSEGFMDNWPVETLIYDFSINDFRELSQPVFDRLLKCPKFLEQYPDAAARRDAAISHMCNGPTEADLEAYIALFS